MTCLLAEVQQLMQQPLPQTSARLISDHEFAAKQLTAKLRSYVAQLRAGSPLYKQIQHIDLGDLDCSVPKGAWQRSSTAGADGEVGCHELACTQDAAHLDRIEQLQAAFVQLRSMQPDSRSTELHGRVLGAAGAVLQANQAISTWERALQVCQQLQGSAQSSSRRDASAEDSQAEQDMQALEHELSAVCAVLSPEVLLPRLQQHRLSTQYSRTYRLPAGFQQHVAIAYAAYRQQLLKDPANPDYAAVADMCRHLQEAAQGLGAGSRTASQLIGQFSALQLLYEQSEELQGVISGSVAGIAAVLAPVALTLFDAAAVISPDSQALLLKLAGCQLGKLQQETPGVLSSTGVAAFSFACKGGSGSSAGGSMFQTQLWLQEWHRCLSGVHTAANAAAAQSPTVVPGSPLSSQAAAALALAAACAAAAEGLAGHTDLLLQHAAVRTSADAAAKQHKQRAALEAERRQVEQAIRKIEMGRCASFLLSLLACCTFNGVNAAHTHNTIHSAPLSTKRRDHLCLPGASQHGPPMVHSEPVQGLICAVAKTACAGVPAGIWISSGSSSQSW
jgi:hypothetical protein